MILKHSKLSYVLLSLVGILFLSSVILSHSISSTYAHENTLNINIASACTFSTGGGNYSVSMVDGSTEINANSITTSCNDASGYAIYAVGYSGDSDTGNNTDLINTANSTYNIKTDGSSDTGSNWKLKFTVVSDATIAGSYNTYQNIPSTYTKVASYTNSTASGIITPHYQINLVGMQQPGTYTGQVKYVLVHPNTMSPTYTINYNANGGSGTMTSSTPSSFENFTLPTSTLTTPTGYSFAGWCTVQDTNQSPQTTCSGTTYAGGATIPASTIASGTTLNLYATWTINTYNLTITFAGTGVNSVKVCAVSGDCTGTDLKGTVSTSGDSVSGLVYNTVYYLYPSFTSPNDLGNWANTGSYGTLSSATVFNPTFTIGAGNGAITVTGRLYMQNMSLSNCQVNVGTNGNATGIGDEITVYDKRDEKDYTVKFINGQCWMTQNLRYLGDTGSAAKTMTIGNNNSNVANKSITLYSLDSSNAGSFNAYSSHCDDNNGFDYACVYDSGSTSTGVWYNYYAASAGTISGSSNSTAATSDICPAGWHLPSGPNTIANTDYNKLVGNTTSYFQNPTAGLTAFSAVAGGRYSNGSLGSTGLGIWWSATALTTALNTTYRDSLAYDSSNGQFFGDNYNYRYNGYFVRCVRSS